MITISKAFLNSFSKRKNILLPIVFLTIFIVIVLIIKAPIKETFEYVPYDEGIDSMNALLFLNGFSLYKKIWTEEPPLMLILLSYWFKLFGPSIYYGRILILIFSCIFLWAFYQTIKILWGRSCALIAVVFLLLSTFFLRMSISIMICTPARAFAMLSIYCVTLYRKSPSKRLLALSGVFMALSLQSKLITAFLIPLIVLEIAQGKWLTLKDKKRLIHCLPPLLLWFSSFLVVYLSIFMIFFHFDFAAIIQHLIQPHLKKIEVPGCNFFLILKTMSTDCDIALLALMGIILLIRQRKWQFFFPVLWLVVAFAILLKHRPIWAHYYLLVSIPISWLAAISFNEFFVSMRNKGTQRINKPTRIDIFLRLLTVVIIILTILRLPGKYNRMKRDVCCGTTPEEHQIVELLLRYKKFTRWIFTDRPIFAFYANILTPPELNVVSDKRNFRDSISQDYCINNLEKYKPELILLEERKDYTFYGPQVISYIERNYIKVDHYKPQPYSSPSYLLPSYRGKVPFFGWIRYILWRHKINVIHSVNNYYSYDINLRLYILKDVRESGVFP